MNLSISILCILFLKVVLLVNKGINELRFVHLSKEVINKYERVSDVDGWGWKENPVQSWNGFLTTNVMETQENVNVHK